MRRIALLVLSLSFICSFSIALEVKLIADKVLYYPEKDIMEALGNVRLFWGDRKASADKGWVNFKTQDAFLEGNVTVEDEKGRLVAQKVSFDSKSEKYLAQGKVLLLTKDGLKLECGKLEAYGKDKFRAYESPIITVKESVLKASEILLEGSEAEIESPSYEDKSKSILITALKANMSLDNEGKIKNIRALGNVFIKHVRDKSIFQAKADEGFYDVTSGIVKISGKASAFKDKTELRANEIIYNVDTGVMRAVGETRMVIH
ncbi:MAG: hypothetical protein N3C62_00230 [Synergistetes bacterium]|nr:hypothetical protein [Synergistota bacterium]